MDCLCIKIFRGGVWCISAAYIIPLHVIDNMVNVTHSFMVYVRTFFPGDIEVSFTRTSEDHENSKV